MQVIVAVAEEGGFSAAGRRLQVVQSAVSGTVRAVERELGVKLFERTTHRVALTSAGEAYVVAARNALAAADDVRSVVDAIKGQLSGRITVGVMQGLSGGLHQALGELRREHPAVVVRLKQAPSEEIIEAIREGLVDLAVVALAGRPRGLVTTTLARERMVILTSRSDQLPRTTVKLSALTSLPFIDFVAGWAIRQEVDRAFRTAGAQRTTAFEVNDILAAAELVRQGLGVTIVPESLTALFSDLRPLRIASHAPTWTIGVVHRRGTVTPITAELLKHLRAGARADQRP
jgi:DNA-binding transcriptional LysR family regulator